MAKMQGYMHEGFLTDAYGMHDLYRVDILP